MDSHTVHTLTQWRLPSPLTGTVKSSLFTHVHSSPLSLAARLHGCHPNCSHYNNNGWTFSGQTSYMHLYLCSVLDYANCTLIGKSIFKKGCPFTFHLKGLIPHKLSFVKSIIILVSVRQCSHPPFPFSSDSTSNNVLPFFFLVSINISFTFSFARTSSWIFSTLSCKFIYCHDTSLW